MKRLRAALTVMLILGLVACGGSGTPSPEPTPTPTPTPVPTPTPTPTPTPDPTPGPTPVPLPEATNNSAVLAGEALGSGFTPNAQLRKEISVSLTTENTTFRLGSAYATRKDAASETLYWFVAVTNESSELQCFIDATELEFQDDTGQPLVTDEGIFVSGSVGISQGSDIYTDTCLSSGDTGYFFGIEPEDNAPSLYSSVSRIVISGIESGTGFEPPAARIVPQRYVFSEGQGLLVTTLNEGTSEARIGDFSHFFFLDEGNLPLSWGFFEGDPESLDDNPVIDAGDTHILNEPFLSYDGMTSKLWTFVNFIDPADSPNTQTPAFANGNIDAETFSKRYTTWRTHREDANRQTLQNQTSADKVP